MLKKLLKNIPSGIDKEIIKEVYTRFLLTSFGTFYYSKYLKFEYFEPFIQAYKIAAHTSMALQFANVEKFKFGGQHWPTVQKIYTEFSKKEKLQGIDISSFKEMFWCYTSVAIPKFLFNFKSVNELAEFKFEPTEKNYNEFIDAMNVVNEIRAYTDSIPAIKFNKFKDYALKDHIMQRALNALTPGYIHSVDKIFMYGIFGLTVFSKNKANLEKGLKLIDNLYGNDDNYNNEFVEKISKKFND